MEKKKNNKTIFLILGLVLGVPIIGILLIFLLGVGSAVAVPTYSNYVEKARSSEIQTYIRVIFDSSKLHYSENGSFPYDIEVLTEYGYLYYESSIMNQWEIDIDLYQDDNYGFGGDICAISTELFSGGAGKVVCYNIETEMFSGYGTSIEANW